MWPVAMQPKTYRDQLTGEIPLPQDPYLHLNIRRSTLYPFLGSLIVHALVLFVVPQKRVGISEPPVTTGDSLVVNLRPRIPSRVAQGSPETISEVRLQPPADHRPEASAAPVIALNKSHAKDHTKLVNPVVPPAPSPAVAEPLVDMLAYVNAARARRRTADDFSGRESTESASRAHEPSEDDIRMAIVKRNLNPGTNGVFQILSMDSRRAAFSFRGWTTDSSNSRREYIQVEIGANSDIEIAIVRKMIELIRRYYKGNFNWESQRLDRIVILSARTEDNDGLEEFMKNEFFGAQSRITRIR